MLIENKNANSKRRPTQGVTLVELLVVISIVSVLTALMIPRLRTINKDRDIREAARIVGSMFATSSQRAVNEGIAGVVIERNPNLIDGWNVNYGVSSLYLMRKVPPFIGDNYYDLAERVSDFELEIDKPFEQDELRMVLVNDSISVNHGSVKYRILDVTEIAGPRLLLSLSSDALPPLPTEAMPDVVGDYPFVVHRQPRKLESSRVDLPNGYLIDMRYSGPLNYDPYLPGLPADLPETPRCYFHEIIKPGFVAADPIIAANPEKNAAVARTTTVIFGDQGGIDRIYFYNPKNPADATDATYPSFIDSKILSGSLYLFVTNYEVSPGAGHVALNSPSSLWVVINNTTGGVNIAYNTPAPAYTVPPPGGDLGPRIIEARGIARNSQSANQ